MKNNYVVKMYIYFSWDWDSLGEQTSLKNYDIELQSSKWNICVLITMQRIFFTNKLDYTFNTANNLEAIRNEKKLNCIPDKLKNYFYLVKCVEIPKGN